MSSNIDKSKFIINNILDKYKCNFEKCLHGGFVIALGLCINDGDQMDENCKNFKRRSNG